MKCIILCRVSTFDQDIDPQISTLKKYAEDLGYTEHHIIETKESGLIDHKDRKGLNELMEFYKNNNEYKTVFCFEISRLSRRQSSLHLIKEWLIENKIQLFILDKKLALFNEDFLVTEDANILFSLYGYFAESEIKVKKERFARSKKYWNEQGFSIGGKLLFGYDRFEERKRKKHIINKTQSNELYKIFNWYLNGIDKTKRNPSIKDIAIYSKLNNFSSYLHIKRNVNKALKEEAYTGLKVNKNGVKFKYPEIINIELFNEVQDKLKSKNLNASKSTKHYTILSKLLLCPYCNRFLIGQYRTDKLEGYDKSSYRCSARKNIIKCDNSSVYSLNMLDSAIWSLIKFDNELLKNAIESINPEKYQEEVNKEIKMYENEVETINLQIEGKKEILIKLNTLKSDSESIIEKIFEQIKIFEAEKTKILKKLNNLINNRDILLNKQNEKQSKLFELEIMTIEKSKSILQDYIRHFIDNIKILYHDTSFTLLEINFIKFGVEKIIQLENKKIYADPIISNKTFLLIDKKVTRSIKSYKINKDIKKNNNELFFSGKKITMENLFKKINNFFQERDTTFNDDFISIPFQKLKFNE
jgi:DNA invertase Pin-like site-specific DNA recombinase